MRYVGLDISLASTGVAILQDGKVELHTVKSDKKKNITERQRDIVDGVLDFLEMGDIVTLEDFGTSAQYGGSSGKLAERIEICGAIKYHLPSLVGNIGLVCAPSQLKSYICGKGTAHKSEVRDVVHRELDSLGVRTRNSDEADAYVLAKVGMGFFTPPENPKQRKIIEKLKFHEVNAHYFSN